MTENESKSKKILIVCTAFAPESEAASVRPTKFAKYLKLRGYNVSVITEDRSGIGYSFPHDHILQRDSEGIKVTRIKSPWYYKYLYYLYTKFLSLNNKKVSAVGKDTDLKKKGNIIFSWFLQFFKVAINIGYTLADLKRRNLAKKAIKALRYSKYDVIITSYPERFSLYVGLKYKETFKNTAWIVDLRDPIVDPIAGSMSHGEKAAKLVKKDEDFERLVYKKCDFILSVTSNMNTLIPDQYSEKKTVLTNGFDVDDNRDIIVEQNKSFSFCLIGSMYIGKRDYSAIFQAVHELYVDGHIDINNLEFVYCGFDYDFRMCIAQAKEYSLDTVLANIGRLPRHELMKIQMSSSILLIGGFDIIERSTGNLPCKIYEYMMAKRPVISVMNGSIINAELSQMIEKCNLGFAFEYSQIEAHFPLLKEYILNQYKSFIKNGDVYYLPNEQEVDKYNHKNLVKKLSEIIESK